VISPLVIAAYIIGRRGIDLGPSFAKASSLFRSEAISAVTGAEDNLPRGREAVVIVNGQYPSGYFPNTEILDANEMRITALGTGMPNQTKQAVSISYFFELGNGDKFLFDVGSGAMSNLFSLQPDFSKIDKVFAIVTQ
jgi:ribonuclease Z